MPHCLQPPFLHSGDTIGIVCPAGYMAKEQVTTCVQTLQNWGFKVQLGETVGSEFHYFSGTDAERCNDMQAMLDNPNISAILFGRGGYGCSRIIDALNWNNFTKNPKWLAGYSDITVFLNHLCGQLQVASIHSPMAGAFNNTTNFPDKYLESLRLALTGSTMKYEVPSHTANKSGEATGMLIGGNLSLLAHLVGTPSDIITDGCILFIEDIGEYLYHADRMLLQLERAGKFKALAGLVVGSFSEMKDTTRRFGTDITSLIVERVAKYNFPVAFDFPVGHVAENYALKVGVTHHLNVPSNNGLVVLQEI